MRKRKEPFFHLAQEFIPYHLKRLLPAATKAVSVNLNKSKKIGSVSSRPFWYNIFQNKMRANETPRVGRKTTFFFSFFDRSG